MPNSEFRFKRFTIVQRPDAGMKVGTDGVLLGAWCSVDASQRRLLDAGTGTGVIALMLAQRSIPQARIDALDIYANACMQCSSNVENSPWSDRVTIINKSLQEYSQAAGRTESRAAAIPNIGSLRTWAKRPPLYDHIVSNPPYFEEALLPPSQARSLARHTGSLPFADLAKCSSALLRAGGSLSVILPSSSASGFRSEAYDAGFSLRRLTEVSTKRGAPPKRVLMEFIKSEQASEPDYGTLAISDADGFTEEYIALTRDFYLDF